MSPASLRSGLLLCVALAATAAHAQRAPGHEAFWSLFEQSTKQSRPIQFEPAIKEPGFFTSYSNQVLRPPGSGPFPAVVLLPSCAGVNDALKARAKEFLAAGFAVLTVDSYGARGQTPWQACGVMFPVMLNDALDGLKHLHTFEAINKQRIYVSGWSTGGAAATWASSPHNRSESGSSLRFAAATTHYSNCAYQENPKDPLAPMLRNDIDVPLLMLIAESDVPVSNCFPLLEEVKAAGKPAQWHVIKGAAHLWDRPDDTRGSRVNGFGQTIALRYSAEATQEATKRTIEFFNHVK